MRQEPSDDSPLLLGSSVTGQDAAKSTACEEEAQHEIEQQTGHPSAFSERVDDAVALPRASKKKVPIFLVVALLAFIAASALGGYIVNAKLGERTSPPVRTSTPPTKPVNEFPTQETPYPPASESTRAPVPADIPSETQHARSVEDFTHPPLSPPETREARMKQPPQKATQKGLAEASADDGYERMDDTLSGEDQDILSHGEAATEDYALEEGEDLSTESREELLEAVNSLDSAFQKFEAAWKSSSEVVQAAFITNYMANSSKEVPSDPIACFQRHMTVAKADVRSGNVSGRAHEDVLIDLRLIRTVLEAASSRIELLRELEKLCDSSGIGSDLLGKKAAPLPSARVLEKDRRRATFDDFMAMLGGFKIRVNAEALETAGTVPMVLAERLAASVKLETAQLENDRLVHSSFQRFALSLPPGQESIVHGRTILGVTPLLDALGRAIVERESNTLDGEAIGAWVADWNAEGIRDRIALNEEDIMYVLRMRTKFYTTAPPDDLFAAIIALI
ncbi:hypothetical protein, conserved [Eimeria praecox]|uniref:Transmembrane protein n=1 Tax=Eimeria praecox TaxID=51316 RepID=U6H818_9EIME|nr:hypothetical protein, conserved [Eimeria praecox]